MNKFFYVMSILFLISCTNSKTEKTQGVSFLNIQDGDTIQSPFLLQMGVEGMVLEPKGAPNPGHGHHHLIVNDGPIDAGLVIIADEQHIHYGGGQSEDSVSLSPGTYDLTLQFADGMHVSYGEEWAETIQVTIK
jgi:hypothetical protein